MGESGDSDAAGAVGSASRRVEVEKRARLEEATVVRVDLSMLAAAPAQRLAIAATVRLLSLAR